MKEPVTFESAALSGTVFGERITLHLDGTPVEAVLAPWEEIRQLGILPREGRPRRLDDGSMAVVFNRWDAATQADIWLVTRDSYETVLGTKLRSIRDLANYLIGAVLVWHYSDGMEEYLHIQGIDKAFAHSVRFRTEESSVYLAEETLRGLFTHGQAVIPGGVCVTIN